MSETRHALFTLNEGDVSVVFPAKISEEGVDHMEEYFTILLRSIRRWAQNARVEADANDTPPIDAALATPPAEG